MKTVSEFTNNGLASDKKNTVCTESNYSYTATQGTVTTSSCIVEIAQKSATGYVDMPSDGEQVLMPTVAQQLVPIAFETEQSSFKSYLSGVLTVACGKRCFRRRPSTPTTEVEAEEEGWTIHPSHCCTFCRPCF